MAIPVGRAAARRYELLAEAVTMITATTLLCSVAIYNGYPLVWPDTGGYLRVVNAGFRSIFYSILVYPAHWTGTLWPVVIAQSFLMSYLLRLVTREVFDIGSRTSFLLVISSLCILSSLPWYTGFLNGRYLRADDGHGPVPDGVLLATAQPRGKSVCSATNLCFVACTFQPSSNCDRTARASLHRAGRLVRARLRFHSSSYSALDPRVCKSGSDVFRELPHLRDRNVFARGIFIRAGTFDC